MCKVAGTFLSLFVILLITNVIYADELDKVAEVFKDMNLTEEQKSTFGRIRIECAKTYKPNPQLVRDYDTGKIIEKIPSIAKMDLCFVTKSGIRGENGLINMDFVRQQLGERRAEIMKMCYKKLDDPEDEVWELHHCFFDHLNRS